ncbi:hypothetical protein JMK10_02410 [Rhodovulum sulfidophilum]|uniref:DUF1932 domain-containing protein n=1 Tax=Rhodovulum sulfidophilum TaxID=35806 RepID=UPI0019213732|nr:NAD(P)-dependent oxidoreductase [Rhodovulum sulfidophilum]MBL3575957.1 NAD(P)-dependent oxidoreductase [Rhodovulum sulfidophilum]MCE8431864.1 hypothetical protein [Rhodovulum sulfidophilum]MCF4115690.1 hypothetical protein [Rhodovulum sulfidophilum]
MGESSRNVILIGYGEVGRAFASRIELSDTALRCVDPVAAGQHSARLVEATLPGQILPGTLVLSAVPSSAAPAVADELASRSDEFLYIDLTSSPQELMRACATKFDGSQTAFVDGAIMGSVDLSGADAPIILSGSEAGRAATELTAVGLHAVALANSQPGDACGLKLLRTLMTKGIEALAVECFAAADRMGLSAEIRANLTDINARPFPDLLDAMVRTHVVHAPRRQHEVAAALEQAGSLGLRAPVTEAVLDAYRRTAHRIDTEKPKPPTQVEQAVRWLAEDLAKVPA